MRVAYLLLTPVHPTFRTEIQKSFLGGAKLRNIALFVSGQLSVVSSFRTRLITDN
jgi:hypothetical protein